MIQPIANNENLFKQVGQYYALRLDERSTLGILGDKARIAYNMCKDTPGVVTCGSRYSMQTCAFAEICDVLHIPCIIVVPSGKDTDSILRIKNTSSEIVRARAGYNTVLNYDAQKIANDKGYKFVRLGMLCDEAYNLVSDNVDVILPHIQEFNRIVVPVGSGTTLIGIVKGLRDRNLSSSVVGVMCGMDATKNIYNALEGDMTGITLIQSDVKYSDKSEIRLIDIELNPQYESKCVKYMEPGDLLYVVSK